MGDSHDGWMLDPPPRLSLPFVIVADFFVCSSSPAISLEERKNNNNNNSNSNANLVSLCISFLMQRLGHKAELFFGAIVCCAVHAGSD
jgi:hypothetical protein